MKPVPILLTCVVLLLSYPQRQHSAAAADKPIAVGVGVKKPTSAGVKKPAAAASTNNALFRNLILNGTCCVPNMSSGYRPVRMKNGKHEEKEDGRSSSTTIDAASIVFGTLNSKPVALAVLSDWGGGSGVFQSLLIYEMRGGRAVTSGSYAFGDRAELNSLKIVNDRVRLVSQQTIGGERGKRKTVLLRRDDFEKAECLQEPLSPAAQKDVQALMEIWTSVSPANATLSEEQKRDALAICARHQADKKSFAEAFRLDLDAEGWRPGATPLAFDKAGKPVFQFDDHVQDFHSTIELTPGK